MTRVRLNIIQPSLPEQRYSCHGCGNCCRDFTVQLFERDLQKLDAQGWDEALGVSPVVTFRGQKYLRQRADGSCVFLMENGLCRIHASYGFAEKPIACQLFPFHLTPDEKGVRLGLNFACQSVQENKGAALNEHRAELRRMSRTVPGLGETLRPPMLSGSLRASTAEVRVTQELLDGWMQRLDVPLRERLDGLAFVVQSLAQAKLEHVRDERYRELLETLLGALPDELELLPVGQPSFGQRRMLRQAVFARTEDQKIQRVERSGRVATAIGQFMRNRRFARGRGPAPRIADDWPDNVPLEQVERIAPVNGHDRPQVEDLISRWVRATILGGRAWGAGFYNWPIVDGLQGMMLNVASAGWLARLHAAGHDRTQLMIDDVRAAVGRIDRTAGRAKWLGIRPEQLRMRYFNADDGFRRLLARYAMVAPDDNDAGP